MFGRKSRAERIKEEARNRSLISGATLATAFDGVKPVAERLLYDDELRDNIRTFIESARKIWDEISDESPTEIVTKLWDDDKLRREIEAAAEAAQEGATRLQGQRVRKGGGFAGKLLLLLILLGVGYLFINPKTGPEARRLAGNALGSLRGGS